MLFGGASIVANVFPDFFFNVPNKLIIFEFIFKLVT